MSIEEIELSAPVPVYDLTVERDHCYFANDVLVSNSDALRTMSEAHRNGMIEGTSMTARESRRGQDKPRVIRGPGPNSYPVGFRGATAGFGKMNRGKPRVIR